MVTSYVTKNQRLNCSSHLINSFVLASITPLMTLSCLIFLLPCSIQKKSLILKNLLSDFPTNGFVVDSTHPKPLPPPLSLPLSLSLRTLRLQERSLSPRCSHKAYFTGPSAVLWLVAVVGMFIDNKQLIGFLPNELPHAYQWKGCNLAPRIEPVIAGTRTTQHSRNSVSKPNDPGPAEVYFAFSSSSALEPLDSTRALLHRSSPHRFEGCLFNEQKLSEKRASENRGSDVEPGRRHRTRTRDRGAGS